MNRINRKNAVTMEEAVLEFLKSTHLASQHNTHLVFKAWDEASGAEKYTLKKYFRDGKLYITLSSSVVCSQLQFRKQDILDRINSLLESDPLFIADDRFAGKVQQLILK